MMRYTDQWHRQYPSDNGPPTQLSGGGEISGDQLGANFPRRYVDYVSPQKLNNVLYPIMHRPSYQPRTTADVLAVPSAPVKVNPRSSRIPSGNANLARCSQVSPLKLFSRTSSAQSSRRTTKTPLTQGRNQPRPPYPTPSVRTTSGKSIHSLWSSNSMPLSSSSLSIPTYLVGSAPRLPHHLCFERVGMPHLNVFRVKLPLCLIEENLDVIIDRAEHHSKTLQKGWKTDLYSLTKCDLACRDIPGIKEYVEPVFEYICLAMKILYGADVLEFDKNQPHLLKYSAAMGHTGVRLHHDRCDVTANLALSSPRDYEGGGTLLVDIGIVVKLQKGEVLLHPGSLVHGGMNITKGTRYLLVTFAHFQ